MNAAYLPLRCLNGVLPVTSEVSYVLQLLVLLVIFGVVLYLINTYIPMAPPLKTVLNVVVVLFLCVWLLNAFGLLSGPLPRFR